MRHTSNIRSLENYRRTLNRRAVSGLRALLAEFGYTIVPAIRAQAKSAIRRSKRLACPRCSRRFALPMNLGRHLSATHGRRKKAA